MEINYISIGKKIREFRTAKNWTQAMLAEYSGVEPSNISHIERAATKVSLPTLVQIANALDVSLDELVCDSLLKNEHIISKQLNELIADCSSTEMQSIIEVVKTTKSVLRKKG